MLFNESLPRVEMSFTYVMRDEDDDVITRVERTIKNEDAEFLGNILSEFRFFLWQMTFNYVENVIVTTEGGNEITAEDM
jgi:hypothetical protein